MHTITKFYQTKKKVPPSFLFGNTHPLQICMLTDSLRSWHI